MGGLVAQRGSDPRPSGDGPRWWVRCLGSGWGPNPSAAAQPFRGATKPVAQVIASRIKGALRTRLSQVHLGQKTIETIPWREVLLLASGAAQPAPDRRIPIGILLHQDPLLQADGLGIGNAADDGLEPKSGAGGEHQS